MSIKHHLLRQMTKAAFSFFEFLPQTAHVSHRHCYNPRITQFSIVLALILGEQQVCSLQCISSAELAMCFVTVSRESSLRSESGSATIDTTEVGDFALRSKDTAMRLALVSQQIVVISESLVTVLVLTGKCHRAARCFARIFVSRFQIVLRFDNVREILNHKTNSII